MSALLEKYGVRPLASAGAAPTSILDKYGVAPRSATPPAAKPSLQSIEQQAQAMQRQGVPQEQIIAKTQAIMAEHGYDKPEVGGFQEKMQGAIESPVGQGVLKAANYLSGLTTTAASYSPPALIARAAAGRLPTWEETKKDIGGAVTADPTPLSQLLEQSGVPEGDKLSSIAPGAFSYTGEGLPLQRGGPLDLSAREGAGFAGEMFGDPLTYTGVGGVAKIAKLGKLGKISAKPLGTIAKYVVNPAQTGLKKSGETFFKSAMRPIERALKKAEQKSVSTKLITAKGTGSKWDRVKKALNEVKSPWEGMYSKVDDLQRDVGKRVAGTIEKAEKTGIQAVNNLDKSKGLVRRHLRDDLITPKQADAFMKRIGRYAENPSVVQANNWKKASYKKGHRAFKKANTTTPASEIHKQIGLDLMGSVENTVAKMGDEALQTVSEGNKYWAQLETARKATKKHATRAPNVLGKIAGGTADAALVGGTSYAYGFDMKTAIGILLARRLLTAPLTRSKMLTGRALHKAGRSGVVDPSLRRLLINLGDKDEQNSQ